MGISFTEKQQQVIEARNQNILVSAAAGSGKTAVLVERIVRRVTDPEEPVDIDKLLIVTFTSAAASEMRERIGQALEERLAASPEDAHLQRQSALLHNAQITTIDSFCLFVIRNNFNDIGLDPGFRVADEAEAKLLRQDTMEEVLERYFGEHDGEFYNVLEAFSPGGSEKPLAEYVMKLYEFAESFPWPEEWLLSQKNADTPADAGELMKADWMLFALDYCKNLIKDGADTLEGALRVCGEPDGPYMYADTLETELAALRRLLTVLETEPEGMYEAVNSFVFGRLPAKKDESVSTDRREQVKRLRQTVKDAVVRIRENFFFKRPERLLADLSGASRLLEKLAEIALRFLKAYDGKKREKNLLDFSDMEHLALRILVKKTPEGYVPTGAAREYREYFKEIMTDEYQDSNLVQEALLSAISGEEDGNYNRFMVGDVKQSIYRFRLARPEIFMEKYDAYASGPAGCRRINLHRNFRSRSQIIDSVNFVFSRIMGRSLGGVEYDGEAALYTGASYPEGEGFGTELALYDKKDGRLDAKEAEARMIAGRIRELLGGLKVTDRETGLPRRAKYRDMVILLRSNQGWDDVFSRVLGEEGIPVYASSKSGYFQACEVQNVLNLLRVIDNPLQDIPLYGVLTSPLGGFDDKELAWVRARFGGEGKELYAMLGGFLEWAKKEPDASGARVLADKLDGFLEFLRKYRDMAVYTPIQTLLRKILRETGYLHLVSAMTDGEQRRANVEMLLSRAADFERTSYYGLFHFLRYMEQIEKYEIDYGEANVQDENADTVRIMSIHKSKGLEFPVCFVAGLSKRFNMTDAAKPLLMDADMGAAAEYVDTQRRVRCSTVRKNAVGVKLRADNLGEELRVLYVAMTRAKEKMILTGTVDDFEKKWGEAGRDFSGAAFGASAGSAQERLSYTTLTGASCYLDWLLPAVFCADAADVIKMTVVSETELRSRTLEEEMGAAGRQERLELLEAAGELSGQAGRYRDGALAERLSERFGFRYPHENLAGLYTKTTVTELKKTGMEEEAQKRLYEEEETVPYVPGFASQEEGLSGADRGSAYHRVMELLELEPLLAVSGKEREGLLSGQLWRMRESGRLRKEYYDCAELPGLLDFLDTPLAVRMAAAGKRGRLYRERPFVLGLPAGRLNREFPESELVLVQGIIDVYFEEEDGIVVADYKTDRVRTGQELVRRYQAQLDYYAEALERLAGRTVKEKIIYSFALGREIRIE